MKSKSPFAMKSPLLAYKSDMRGNYANPKYVKEELVGVKIGEALTKAGTDIFSGLTTKPKSESGDGSGSGKMNFTFNNENNNNGSNGGSGSNVHKGSDTDITTTTENVLGSDQGNTGNSYADSFSKLNKTSEGGNAIGVGDFKGGNLDDWTNYVKDYNSKKNSTTNTTRNEVKRTWTMNDKGEKVYNTQATNPVTMKGSPFEFAGVAQAAAAAGNQAQQRAAGAGGSTGIDPFAPQPNQAQISNRSIDMSAISDPYSALGADFGAGTRNKAQSIYGSAGQRQGLMNLGTPLHHDSEKQSHSHPSKTTTKMKPDGEYPGARYVKGDLVDQDDLLDKTELDVHIATQVQSDKKGSFIKEMPDSGPGSDIETDRGFGKKIRLGSMGRSSYTSNMKDQSDPHNFLFQNTPKK